MINRNNALLVLGALYALENTGCASPDCEECPDMAQEVYRALSEAGALQTGFLTFGWDRGLTIQVSDPMVVALKTPALMRSLQRLRHDGFRVTFADQTTEAHATPAGSSIATLNESENA